MNKAISPLCPSGSIVLLQEEISSQLIQQWKQKLNIDITQILSGVDTIQLWRCRDSNLNFFWPLSIAGPASLYESLSENPVYYSHDKWEFEVGASLLDRRDTRVLEIGCGEGAFLQRIARHLDQPPRGLEINLAAAEKAKTLGLDVQNFELREYATEHAGEFDFVCSFQTLEHVINPAEMIASMILLLKPGGALLISVPDGDGYLSRTHNLLDGPPHHMLRWNAAALQFLTKLFPISLHDLVREPVRDAHVPAYLQSQFSPTQSTCSQSQVLKISQKLLLRLANIFFKRTGVHRFLPGHTILAVYRKTSP
jgi:2-polyprenyl-3-methyl-5-hydroxy-6-metoxy-1,4-benzoquinol methylase